MTFHPSGCMRAKKGTSMKRIFGFLLSTALLIAPAWAGPLVSSQGPILQANQSAKISTSSAGLTQVVVGSTASSATQRIYVINWNVMANGTTTFQWEYGTGTNCGTGTQALTGAYPLTAQTGAAIGAVGPVLILPPGNSLCFNLGSAVAVAGSFAYVQQ